MSKTLLKEKREKLAEKSKALKGYMDKAGEDLDFSKVEIPGITGEDTKGKIRKIREMNDELNGLGVEVEDLQAIHEIPEGMKEREKRLKTPVNHYPHAGPGNPAEVQGRELKGFGDMFVDTPEYKAGLNSYRNKDVVLGVSKDFKEGPEEWEEKGAPYIGIKTLFETSNGWTPETTRIGRVIEDAQRPIQVIDAIPAGQTGQAAIVYMEETTFVNNSAETAEGAQFPENELEVTEQTVNVKKIAAFIPVTDEQLEDVAQARSYLNQRLPFMLRQRLDSQILNGDGAGANLRGILNVVGIQIQAKGDDPIPDTVFKAMTKTRLVGRAIPDLVMLHPNDWQRVRLLRTADGIYIWGSPAEQGPERMWGRRVIQADSLAEGEGLVGDFRNFVQLFERRGVTVKVSDSHSDFFIKGKQAIRADMRVALVIYRPAAFVKLTGLNA